MMSNRAPHSIAEPLAIPFWNALTDFNSVPDKLKCQVVNIELFVIYHSRLFGTFFLKFPGGGNRSDCRDEGIRRLAPDIAGLVIGKVPARAPARKRTRFPCPKIIGKGKGKVQLHVQGKVPARAPARKRTRSPYPKIIGKGNGNVQVYVHVQGK